MEQNDSIDQLFERFLEHYEEHEDDPDASVEWIETEKARLRIEEKDAPIWHGLALIAGKLFEDNDDNDEAERLLRKSVESDPTYTEGWVELSRVLLEIGEDDSAEAACWEAIKVDDRNRAAWANLGILLRNQRKYECSEAACRELIRIDPRYAGGWYNLGS